MREKIFFVFFSFFVPLLFSQDVTSIYEKICSKPSSLEAMTYAKTCIKSQDSPEIKRALLVFLAELQEQMGQYQDAVSSYIEAASIKAQDAKGSGTNPPEKLILNATKCQLCCGNYEEALSYLSSDVAKTKDQKILSKIKLYTAWAKLCDPLVSSKEVVRVLDEYIDDETMQSVTPQVLLTLWKITKDETYSRKLKTSFPKSCETSVIQGNMQLMPTPFWYFALQNGDVSKSNARVLQLGLFKDEKNALSLLKKTKDAGFLPYIKEETRASGTKYFLVLVDDNDSHTLGELLQEKGFENYPIESEDD